MKILVIESNLPDGGIDDAHPFQRALQSIDPTIEIAFAKPYGAPVTAEMLQGVDGVIFTGSGVDWSADDARAAPLHDAARLVFEAGVPAYGSCNGAQLAAHVLGGALTVSPNGREDGLARDIRLTEAGRTHPFLAGRQQGYAVPAVHRDEIARLPDGAILLAENDHSAVQAFAYERDGVRFWGVQYHPEFSTDMMAGILPNVGDYPDAVCADFRVAEKDADAARRLGTTSRDMQPATRLTEIANWVASLSA